MIREFTNNTELKRIIEEQQIKSSQIKAFMKKRGVMLLSNSSSDLANSMYSIFLGSEDLNQLQQLINEENNYQKSTMLVLGKNVEGLNEDLLDTLSTEFNRYKTISNDKEFSIDNICLDGEKLQLQLSYEKRLLGKMSFMSVKTNSFNVFIEKENDGEIKIDIRHNDKSDSKKFIDFLENIQKISLGQNNNFIFNIKHINLEYLSDRNKVDFFDSIIKEKIKEWKLLTITGITVKNSKLDESEDIDESSQSKTNKIGTLAGITSAVLKGNSLRENEFVNNCINDGFLITSMKIKYESNIEPKCIVVEFNCSNTDMKIDIFRTYIEEDNKEYSQPLPFSEQDEAIKLFQKTAYGLYNKLIETQKKESCIK